MERSSWVRRGRAAGLLAAGAAVGLVALSPVGADSGGGGEQAKSAARVPYSPPIVRYFRSARVSVAGNSTGSAIAKCPKLYRATGGGGVFLPGNNVAMVHSIPSNGVSQKAGRTAWEFRVENNTGQARNVRAYVICVKTRRVGGNYNPGVAAL